MNKTNIGTKFAIGTISAVFINFSASSQIPTPPEYKSGLLAEVFVTKSESSNDLNQLPSSPTGLGSIGDISEISRPRTTIKVPMPMGVPPFTGRGLDSRVVQDMASSSETSTDEFSGLQWDGFIRSQDAGQYTYQVMTSGLPRSADCMTGMKLGQNTSGPVKISRRVPKTLEMVLAHDKGMIPFSLWVNCNTSIVSSSVSLDLQRKDSTSLSFKQVGANEFFHVPR